MRAKKFPYAFTSQNNLQLTVRRLKKYNDYWRVINYGLTCFTDIVLSVFNFLKHVFN